MPRSIMNMGEVREFLMSRRAKVTPAQVGLPDLDNDRRVSELRGEEVAQLAGVSLEYYTRLEAATSEVPPTASLDAVARALQLSDLERGPPRSHAFRRSQVPRCCGAP